MQNQNMAVLGAEPFGRQYKLMIMYEQDPDVVRWGLHHLDICRIPSGGSPGSSIHYEKDLSQVECVKEGYCEKKCDEVENDEIIAHALQEELSLLAAAEASGSSQAGEEDLQASILSQDWRVPSNRHFTVEHGGDHRDTDERGNSGSCSSLGEESNFVESQPYSPEIANESVLDGEVGKRLNQMVPVPHVPKINGDLPSADEEMSDHQSALGEYISLWVSVLIVVILAVFLDSWISKFSILDRLRLYDLVELKVQGDGNCQFRALSDQIYRTTEHHKLVREQVVGQLKSLPELYEGYVPMAYDHYLQNISKTGEWGDHVTLQAAADTYGLKIFIITSFKDTCYIEILPHTQKSERIIFLSFWAEVHYNSIYPEGVGVSSQELPMWDSFFSPHNEKPTSRLVPHRSAGSRGEEKEKMVDALIMLMGLAAYFMPNDFMQGRKLQFGDLLPLSWSLERKKAMNALKLVNWVMLVRFAAYFSHNSSSHCNYAMTLLVHNRFSFFFLFIYF
ncbi:hypothetical protein RHMOL_Rhmol03G0125500 [Rhododendron molle]|uniref:Uncharacterized protein n=1 Tax=Rhododendron molle TaxID=49168 RepID=A0ACC0PF46_RHOML|nr:hypothetical protein RHMOL_Rhmol03G0125500 [Rhododendron molle]